MKILITGGAGFIGSNFIFYMIDRYGIKLFETESEACEFFLRKMKRYARK